MADDLIEGLAVVLWYEAKARLRWEQADPEDQEHYREKAEAELSEIFCPGH